MQSRERVERLAGVYPNLGYQLRAGNNPAYLEGCYLPPAVSRVLGATEAGTPAGRNHASRSCEEAWPSTVLCFEMRIGRTPN